MDISGAALDLWDTDFDVEVTEDNSLVFVRLCDFDWNTLYLSFTPEAFNKFRDALKYTDAELEEIRYRHHG